MCYGSLEAMPVSFFVFRILRIRVFYIQKYSARLSCRMIASRHKVSAIWSAHGLLFSYFPKVFWEMIPEIPVAHEFIPILVQSDSQPAGFFHIIPNRLIGFFFRRYRFERIFLRILYTCGEGDFRFCLLPLSVVCDRTWRHWIRILKLVYRIVLSNFILENERSER